MKLESLIPADESADLVVKIIPFMFSSGVWMMRKSPIGTKFLEVVEFQRLR
jgi:hypothetical protein